MLIITKFRSSLNFGGVTSTVPELCSFTNGKKKESSVCSKNKNWYNF